MQCARLVRPTQQAVHLFRSFSTGRTLVKTVQSSRYAQTHTTSDVINFGLGQPSASLLPPLEMFRDAAIAKFQPTQDSMMLQYGVAKGFIGFRKEIAQVVRGI